MKLLLSPNAMKGSLSAFEAACAMQAAIERARPEIETVLAPIADGGNGTLECLAMALNADYKAKMVHGPLSGTMTEARWGHVAREQKAVIEMAEASGLHLVPSGRLDALRASTRGVGELIKEAMDAGCRSITVGLGGSATTDGGTGCMRALGLRFLDAQGEELEEGGAALSRLSSIDRSHIDPRLAATEITLLSDVTNPLTGPDGAAHVFAPQKGATPDEVELLDAALAQYARVLKIETGREIQRVPGAGAAGGLAAGLLALANAKLVSGVDYILDAMEYDRLLAECDAVLTSEGMIDAQTESGKGIDGLCRRAKKFGKPVHAFVGRIKGDKRAIEEKLGLASLRAISPLELPVEEAMKHAKELLGASVEAFLLTLFY